MFIAEVIVTTDQYKANSLATVYTKGFLLDFLSYQSYFKFYDNLCFEGRSLIVRLIFDWRRTNKVLIALAALCSNLVFMQTKSVSEVRYILIYAIMQLWRKLINLSDFPWLWLVKRHPCWQQAGVDFDFAGMPKMCRNVQNRSCFWLACFLHRRGSQLKWYLTNDRSSAQKFFTT